MTDERFNFLCSFPKFTLAIADRREDIAEDILHQYCGEAPASSAQAYAVEVQSSFGVKSDQAIRAWDLVTHFES